MQLLTLCILLDGLENEFAVSGLARVWLKYYILKEHIVFPVVILYSIKILPQGCVLGPLLFSLNISTFGSINKMT